MEDGIKVFASASMKAVNDELRHAFIEETPELINEKQVQYLQTLI